jgi:flagellar motor switch protein FliM
VPLNQGSEVLDLPRPLTRARGEVTSYDFRRPTKLSREHVRLLQMAYDTFARRLATVLTSKLRQVCQVSLIDIAQYSYEEYVTGLDSQTLLVPVSAPPLAGTGVLQFALPTALASVDYMLGGPGGSQPARTLTDIETTLLGGLLDQMIGVLRYALEPIVVITPTLGAIEYNPQFLQAAGSTDAMVVAQFEMVVGSESGTATLCLPLVPLLPVLMMQRPTHVGADVDALGEQSAAALLRERLGEVPLDVSVQFESFRISPERILTLSEGDVVVLEHRVGVPLTLRAGATVFAQAVAGKAGNRLAALIVDTSEELV